MVRMIVSLPATDKKWLEATSRRERISSAEVVRRAVGLLRSTTPDSAFRKAIRASAGRWPKKGPDSQILVDALRAEWER